ncbi:hypothetical protein CFAM422_007084 [Trichoderma lentiforme]|uniref:Uncharacterized protein n=1 Tax=Trichoderma lentiforme TaxID=1567552 RepID=A0A9P5CAV7_9HYPO|nr:hypothetical protein CFAM422_007084 [Trichoderma lentiforme]
MPQARVSGGARPTRRAAAGDRERDNGGGFDDDADASAARLGGCSTEAKARQRLNCPDKGQSQQQATVVGALSSARGCSRWSLGSRTRRFLSRAVANRLSATGGRIAAGRDAAMDWMFVEGRDADAHEMVFGDRYQEERPAVGGGASTLTLRLDWRCSGHSNSMLPKNAGGREEAGLNCYCTRRVLVLMLLLALALVLPGDGRACA